MDFEAIYRSDPDRGPVREVEPRISRSRADGREPAPGMALDCCAVEEIRPRTRQQRDRVVAGEGAEIRAIEMALFDELEQGDLLFFDGSHRVFQNSDVTVFFLEVLPRLKPGVLVHIHDIFLPDDYPANWTSRLFSEQYMLGAMVLCQTAPFRIILPNYYVSGHDELSQDVRELFRARGGEIMPAAYFRGAKTVVGSSFWIETVWQSEAIPPDDGHLRG